jgi:hypothetical protein
MAGDRARNEMPHGAEARRDQTAEGRFVLPPLLHFRLAHHGNGGEIFAAPDVGDIDSANLTPQSRRTRPGDRNDRLEIPEKRGLA